MKLTIEVPDNLIETIGCSVACDYWAEYREIETGEYAGRLEFREIDRCDGSNQPGDWLVLTPDRERLGLELMATKAPRSFGQALAGNADGTTGDVWLQLALLGEVKYG